MLIHSVDENVPGLVLIKREHPLGGPVRGVIHPLEAERLIKVRHQCVLRRWYVGAMNFREA